MKRFMDIQAVTTICSSIGFPIVMCLLLFSYIKTEQKETRDIINSLKQSVETLSDILKERRDNEKV